VTRRRHDLTAVIRRAFASRGRRTVAVGVSVVVAAVAATVGLATTVAAGAFVATVGVVVAWWIDRHAPDKWFDPPNPVVDVTRSATPGMSEREVYRHLTIHNEREDLREEKIEKERRKRRRQAKTRR